MFSRKISEIFKNTYFVKHLRAAASAYCQASINLDKSLLARHLLLIHLMILYQNKKNKVDAFDCR